MREIKFRAWDKAENKTKRGKGWHTMNGYILQYAPYHPHANCRGYVLEHRLIIENSLGRYLVPRKEIVHHIDENRSNNTLSNLRLSNPKDHAKGHVGSRNGNGTFVCKSVEFQKKKFRLYDTDRNLMRVFTLNELIAKTYRRGSFEYRGEFTGLTDKNGVEIYEGDVLSTPHFKDAAGRSHILKHQVVWSKKFHGWFLLNCHSGDENDGSIQLWISRYGEIEVIGNIYMNPELLEATA